MVMEVAEPFVKKKSAKKTGNVNARLTKTANTVVAVKNVEIAASNMEKGKTVMKPIAKIIVAAKNAEIAKSNIEKGKAIMNHIKVEDDIDVTNNVWQNIKKVSRIEKQVTKNARVAHNRLIGGNVLGTKKRRQTNFNNVAPNRVRQEIQTSNNVFV